MIFSLPRSRAVFFAQSVVLGVLICACDNGGNFFVIHCATASQCLGYVHADNPSSCTFAPPGIQDPTAFWQAYDFNLSNNISAVTTQTVSLFNSDHQQQSTVSTSIPVYALADPKTPGITGGPSNADQGGPPFPLTCEYKDAGSGNYYQYSYSTFRACYNNDPTCPNLPPPISASYTQIYTCDQECSKPGGRCSNVNLGAAPAPVATMMRQLISGTLPMRLDPAVLTALAGNASNCSNQGPVNIDAAGEITSVGSGCSSEVGLPQSTPWYTLATRIPPTLLGNLTRISTDAIIVWEPTATASVDAYLDSTSPPNFTELLTATRVRSTEILFAGQGKFCARLTFSD